MGVGWYPRQSGGVCESVLAFRDVYPVRRRPCRASLLSKELRAIILALRELLPGLFAGVSLPGASTVWRSFPACKNHRKSSW